MINLSSRICYALKEARKAAKLSQSEVAAIVGCKQSALSMFEQGDGTKLNDEVVRKLAKKFGVELKEGPEAANGESGSAVPTRFPLSESVMAAVKVRGFCPNPRCPTNHAYEVEGRVYFRPDRNEADPVGGRFCAFCGEVLEKRCPGCGAPLHDGAVCSFCGEPYVASVT